MAKQLEILLLLCLLYFLQGIPYGVQMRSLPIYYHEILKYPIGTITNMSLLMCPWFLLKPLLICFIDVKNYCFPLLYLSLAAKTVLNITLYFLFLQTDSFYLIMISLFLVNCITVFFDVATDRLLIATATSATDFKFLGISNAIQIVAYKFGAFFSGFVLLFIDDKNISLLFLVTSVIYFITVVILFLNFENYFVNTDVGNDNTNAQFSVFSIFSTIFSSKTNFLFLLFILTYKMGELGAISLLPLYTIESGVSRQNVKYFTSTICDPLSLLASLLGGAIMWSVEKGNANKMITILTFVSILRIVPLLLQAQIFGNAIFGELTFLLSFLSMAMLWFLSGLVSTFVFTLMSTIACWAGKDADASYFYAVFSSAEVFGKLVFNSQAGRVGEYVGKQNLFSLFSLFIVLNWTLLYALKHFLLRDLSNEAKKK